MEAVASNDERALRRAGGGESSLISVETCCADTRTGHPAIRTEIRRSSVGERV